MAIAALIIATLALALSICGVAAMRFLLQRIQATLSQPPPAARATLTAEEERRLREGFHEALRRHR